MSNPRWTLVVASVAGFIGALDSLIVSTALGSIQREFGWNIAGMQWLVNGYNLSFALALIPAAALGDRFGRRRVFAVGLAVFGIGSLLCALAISPEWLVAARVFQGFGGGATSALGFALISAAFAPAQRGRAMGIMQGVSGLAIVLGPVLGGLLSTMVGWRSIFWINVPVILVLLVLLHVTVAESRGIRRTVDGVGLVLVTLVIGALTWALTHGPEAGWIDAATLVPLGLAVAAAVALVRWERRTPDALFAPALLRRRTFLAGNGAGAAIWAFITIGVFFFPQMMQWQWGFTPIEAGLGILPWTAALIVVGPLAGMLADRIGARIPVIVGLGLAAASFLWIGIAVAAGAGYVAIVAPLLLASIGISLAMPSALAASVDVPAADIGTASGTSVTVRQLSATLGVAIATAAFTAASPAGADTGPGVLAALAVAVAAATAGAVIAGPRLHHGRPEHPAEPALATDERNANANRV